MISAVIIAKNEEKDILDCLRSLSWCDEVILVDDNSTDRTVDIAKKTKAKIFSHALGGDFAKQRNYGLEKAKGEWVLFIDADERVSPALWYEIMERTNSLDNYVGYYVKRKDIMWGKELRYGEVGSIKILRLAKRGVGKWSGKVHETWKVKGKTAILNNSLLHYPHNSVEKFLEEINFYSDLRAKELFSKRKRVFWWSVIIYPKAKFILNYFVRRGFLDGLPGLVFALMMSFHSFLVRGKLWQLWQKGQKV